MKTRLWISVFALVAVSSFAVAQDTPSGKKAIVVNSNTTRPAFVDNNKDGICDNVNKAGKGNCNGFGRGQGVQNGNGNCTGQGKGQGQCCGKGNGANFVDANNNGICDHKEKSVPK
jgi:hypothetical protein